MSRAYPRQLPRDPPHASEGPATVAGPSREVLRAAARLGPRADQRRTDLRFWMPYT